MARMSPLDRMEHYFNEIERICDEERPLTVAQKCAMAGLVALAVGLFWLWAASLFQL